MSLKEFLRILICKSDCSFKKNNEIYVLEKADFVKTIQDWKIRYKALNEKYKDLEFRAKQLLETLNNINNKPAPVTKGSISYSKLNKLLEGKTEHFFNSDMTYKLVTLESMKDFLKRDTTDTFEYTKTWFDCDDFAYRLQGNLSVPGWSDIVKGIAWTYKHAFNIVVTPDLQIWIIEPQSDHMIKYEEASSFYKPFRMVVL